MVLFILCMASVSSETQTLAAFCLVPAACFSSRLHAVFFETSCSARFWRFCLAFLATADFFFVLFLIFSPPDPSTCAGSASSFPHLNNTHIPTRSCTACDLCHLTNTIKCSSACNHRADHWEGRVWEPSWKTKGPAGCPSPQLDRSSRTKSAKPYRKLPAHKHCEQSQLGQVACWGSIFT